MQYNHRQRALAIIKQLRVATKGMVEPASVSIIKEYGRDSFLVLISCLLSLRTKDTTSLPASRRLFKLALTPQKMLTIPVQTIQKAIYPVGFYKRKAAGIHMICTQLIAEFNGIVPNSIEELLKLKGVGRKTANLVLAEGFGFSAICVDVHVHRISNRLGLVQTKTPEETEYALQKLLPQEYWSEYNKLMVMWGQNRCVPISPKCLQCLIVNLCPRVGVTKSR